MENDRKNAARISSGEAVASNARRTVAEVVFEPSLADLKDALPLFALILVGFEG